MKVSLLVVTPGKQEGKQVPVARSPFVIGRDPDCHLRPASPSISGRHCALEVRGDKLFVCDFGSTNGTFVNGTRISAEKEVRNSDRLKVGPLEFVVGVAGGAPPDQPPSLVPEHEPDEETVASLLLAEEGDDEPDDVAFADEEVPPGATVHDHPATVPAGAEPARANGAARTKAPLPAPPPQVKAEEAGEAVVVTLTGVKVEERHRIEAFKKYVLQVAAARSHPKIILNLNAVEFMESTFLAAMVDLDKKLKAARGALVLCKLRPVVAEVFETLQLGRFIKVCKEESEALRDLCPEVLSL